MSIVSPNYFGGASYTMRLKKVIELVGGKVEKVDGLPVMTGGDIGLNNYPIFNSAYREHLNGRIIGHYYNREIGMETSDMFIWAVEQKMMEVMPYYNKLYSTEQISYDPLSTVDIRTLLSGETDTTSESDTTATNETGSKSRSIQSDTPQTMLKPDADYATSGADSLGESTVESVSTGTATEKSETDSETHTTGYQGVPAELIMRYRDSLLNIDLSVIAELEECFMQVWNTTDPYTPQRGYYL